MARHAPGLEEGEQQDDVGYLVRVTHESNGKATPYLLLYSANESQRYSFLKVYLNTERDIAAFELASGVKLATLKEYDGGYKLERGKSAKTDAYIHRVKPFGVVYKTNPKFVEADREAAVKRGEVYKVPQRLFVRWADQHEQATETKPAATPAQPTPVPAADEPTPTQQHERALRGMDAAQSRERLDEWWAFRSKLKGLTVEQEGEAMQVRARNLKRLSGAQANNGTAK